MCCLKHTDSWVVSSLVSVRWSSTLGGKEESPDKDYHSVGQIVLYLWQWFGSAVGMVSNTCLQVSCVLVSQTPRSLGHVCVCCCPSRICSRCTSAFTIHFTCSLCTRDTSLTSSSCPWTWRRDRVCLPRCGNGVKTDSLIQRMEYNNATLFQRYCRALCFIIMKQTNVT